MDEVLLEEGDWIRYEGQYGIILRIWETESEVKWELVLRDPDKKIWCEDRNKIELVYPSLSFN